MRALLAVACAALVLVSASVEVEAQPTLGAPAISSVTAGTNDLTVVWTAPAEDGGATITSYDVRYIESDAADKADANWSVLEGIWSSGTLSYKVAGLYDGTGYDIEVRADNGANGPWSATSTGTTTDHGGTTTAATTVTLGSSTPGRIKPASDSDVFRFTLTGEADVWLYATGELDSEGVLTRGRRVTGNNDGLLPPNPLGFSIRALLDAGTYTVAVGSSNQLSTGTYTLHVQIVTQPGGTLGTATAISLGSFHHGLSGDISDDYYTFTLTETTDVWAAVVGFGADLDLLAADGTSLATTRGRIWYHFPSDEGPPDQGQILLRELPAGSYYIKVEQLVTKPTTLFFYTATDPGNSTAGAVQLSPFIPAAGHVSANGDQDYFSITVDQKTYLYLDIVSVGERLPFEIAVLQDGSPVSFFTIPAASFRRTNTAVIARVWGEFSPGTYHVEITAPEGTIGRYMVYPYIDRAYRDLVRTCTALTTDKSDPFFGCQWHLNNRAHIPGGAGHDINIEEAWAITKGEGAKVAIVDDGLHYSHEDLTDNVITANNHDFSGENDPSKVFGLLEFHGTNVAGILAARDNMLGGQGVAPRASIYGYNVTSHLTDDSIARALNLHLDETTVANNSWGIQHTMGDGPVPAPAVWIAALRTGVERGPNGRGISYVWAAGNAHSTVDANYDELTNYFAVTTVCGVNYKDTRALISEVGANLWVCAPTQGIIPLTTGIPQPGILTTDNGDRYIANFSGTSASAPIVSGVIALVRAANPNLTWRDAKLILANSARKNHAGNTGWLAGALKYGSTTDRYSFNHEYGFGVVDAGAAVTLAGTWTKLPALREYEVASDGTDLDIPDLESGSSPTAVESTVTLDSYVEFIEYVELNMDWDHASIRDLKIELESPSGAVSTIAPAHASATGIPWRTRFRFGSSRHLGEDAAGTWTLRVTDVLEEHGGSVRSWSLKVYGHGSVPGFPDITSTTPASNSITVAWSAPGIVGASDITAYDVRYIRSDAADKSDGEWTLTEDVWTATGGGDLEYTMSGLTGNVQYDVRVRAVNAEGDGPWSAVGTATPPIDRAPTIDSVTPGDRSIIVGWTAPTSATLGTITSYDLRYIRSDASNKADDNRTVVSAIWTSGPLAYTLNPTAMPLVNGVSYDVQVRAVVGPDQHPWSGVRSAKPHTTPGIPTIDTVTGGDGAFAVEWNRPLSDGGDEITSYDLRHIKTSEDETVEANWTVEVGVWSSGDSGLEYDVAGLETGTQYDVQVRAVNAAGEGAWSATSVGTTRPGAPAIDSVTGLARGLTVGWSAAATDGDATVTTYDLRYIKTSDDEAVEANWTVEVGVWSSGDLTATVTGLDVGTQYDVQMRAFNASGEGPWSPTRMGTTALSDDATLSALTLSGARLTPAFKSGTTSYTASVGYTVARITVASTTSNVNATVEFLDGDDNTLSTADTVQVDLSVGENTIKVEVTAQDGVATETYTITVTRTEEDLSLTPSASDPVAPFVSTAIYTIRFRGAWTRTVTPDGLPNGAHFSRLIGAVHNADVTFLESGGAASPGVESMAEIGGTSTLKDEVNSARNADPPTALAVLEGSTSSISPTATRTLSARTLTTEFPRVTLTTMIAPSHDWFVGVSGLPLLDASGRWLRSREVDLFPWDAGTEEGADFSLSPSVDTTPRGDITSIRGTGKFTTERIASLTFTLQSVRTVRSLVENTPGGVNIGAPVAATANSGTVSYTLGGTDAASFDLDDTSGQLRTKSGVTYDYDLKSSYTVTVTATDTDGSIVTTVDIAVENIDERPEISGLTSIEFAENRTGTVTTYRASDPEGEAVTWLPLAGPDSGAFELSARGALTFKAPPNREAKEEYAVTLRASADGEEGMQTGTLDVTVTITNVNEPPVVDGARTIDHAENEGTALANASYSATDPERANIIWSVGGNDGGKFAISDSGVLSFAAEPDFDIKGDRNRDNIYEVTVQATEEDDGDADALTGTLAVIVTLSNFDEPPVISGPQSVTDYPENSPTTRVVDRYMATDPEGAGVTWSNLAGNDAGKFEFSNTGVLTFKVSPNFEQQPEYEVTLNAFDGGLTGRLTVTVTIADVNEPPVVARSSGMGAFSIEENSGTAVGSFDAMDPEDRSVTWSLARSGDHGRFEIDANSGALSFKMPPDYESSDLGSDEAYNVNVQATEEDDGVPQTPELTGSLAVTVVVTNVNEPPTVTGNATPSVDENTTAVATYSATDPDERATITWSVEDPGASDFTITNAGALSFASAPNYEVKSSYTVTVRASDGTNDVPHDVTVTVTDVDEREVLGLSHRTPLIGEEFTAAFEEGTGDNVDSVQPPTWAWARSAMGSSSGWMPITDATNATYEPTGDDRERYLRVTASYNDGHGQGRKTLSATSEFATAATRASNTPPTFPSPLFTGGQTGLSVRENAGAPTVVGVAPQATDMQGGTLSYSLAVDGFTSDPPFEINPTSRQIRVAPGARLNHERQNTYGVTVTVVDEFDATETATFDITITDVNEPPVAVADPAVTTEEDTPVTFDVLGNDTDPDEGDTLTVMTITTQPGRGRVVVDTNTQMLTYTPAKDDHDTYTFMYTARDDDPVRMLTSPAARVTVTVNPVNDAPEFETEMTTRTVSESAQPGDEVGTKVAATDVDDITLTYSLSGASDFVIDATGQIQVAPGVTLDREGTPSYDATVTATDRSNASDSITVTINVSNVNEAPTAMNDTAMTAEDTEVKIDVLDNDTDPDTEKAALRVSVLTQPLNGRARVESDRTITYTPNANFAGENSFTYSVSDGSLSDAGSVTVSVEAVNDAPTFPSPTAARSVPVDAEADDDVGAPVTAMDVDDGDTLRYSLSGADSGSFNIDSNGQIAVATGVTFDIATQETYVVTVTADDGSGEANATATVEVTITVTAGPPIIIITGGGGGGGGGGGPSPSEVDFEWTVKRDIEELDGGNDRATGVWSDGTTLWVADNADGAGDAVYAYDRESGERLSEREFALHETNRAPRGFWSDRSVVWVSDSGRERLFAYDLATGERLEEREFALAAGNSDARGIWSDEETMWVLDGRADALFAYALASGELLAEYALDSANDDPRGIWSDGVTIWVSDHGAKRLIAYRLPVLPDAETDPGEEDADEDARELERVRDEEFTELSKASNNSPRGIWSDGDVMYVADESDDRVYSYNMPDAIDARLASLSLSGVDIGEFSPSHEEYEGAAGEGVTETTVTAEALQRRTEVAIDPPDADEAAEGYQVALEDLGEITVTVTSADGSRERVYRVRLGEEEAAEPAPEEAAGPVASCLRGDVAVGFSLVVYAGGSIEDLVACAEGRNVAALYVLDGGEWVSYIVGAPEFVNRSFAGLFAEGLAALTPLIARSDGPASPDPSGDAPRTGDATQPWPACLQGEIAEGFNLVVYEGGSVGELEACAEGVGLAALYSLSDGVWVSYILGAPEFVNLEFRELFTDGVPSATPLVGKRDAP